MIRASILLASGLGAAMLTALSPAAARGAQSVGSDSLRVCVLVGDTLVGGKRFREAYPAGKGYAESAPWYSATSWLDIGKRRHEKLGQPRLVPPELLVPAGHHRGVPLFAATGAYATVPPIYYAPVRPGCVFQPYGVPVH